MPGMLTMMAHDGLGQYQDHTQLFDNQQTRQGGQMQYKKGLMSNTPGFFCSSDVLDATHGEDSNMECYMYARIMKQQISSFLQLWNRVF
jgi:hypothetical protein